MSLKTTPFLCKIKITPTVVAKLEYNLRMLIDFCKIFHIYIKRKHNIFKIYAYMPVKSMVLRVACFEHFWVSISSPYYTLIWYPLNYWKYYIFDNFVPQKLCSFCKIKRSGFYTTSIFVWLIPYISISPSLLSISVGVFSSDLTIFFKVGDLTSSNPCRM